MAPVLLTLLLAAGGPSFIEDDYAKALATAKKEKKLLFVDAWAPWCHTCIFLREHVLASPDFVPFQKQLVFAAIDTEKSKSAPFLEKFPVDVWPTLFFIDPANEQLVFKWIGSADAAQMQALITAAQRKDAKVSEADALLAFGRAAEASDRYLAALEAGAGDATTRATLSMLSALYSAKKYDVCAETASEQAPKLKAVSDRINALTWGLGCALELDAKPPALAAAGADAGQKAAPTVSAADAGKTAPGRAALLSALVPQAKAALTLEGGLADDVSGLFELLVEERKAAKDDKAVQALGTQWLTYLEAAAAKAKSPAARAVFDAHRVSAALAARVPQRVEAALLLSEKELPADYNPPARLAIVYRELGRLDDALAAVDRALAKCSEGPRKLRLFETKAGVLEKKGDVAGRKKTLEAELAYAKKLPRAQLSARRLAAIEASVTQVKP